jgi:hypothetical protein
MAEDTPRAEAPLPDDSRDDTTKIPAGPHAKRSLTNVDSTPGAGVLPPIGEADDPNLQPTS